MNINEYGKHFFLYAKGWYKESDLWEDLLKLYAINHYVAIDCTYKDEIFHKLTQCALECIMEESRSRSIDLVQDFLVRLSPNYLYRGIGETTEKYDYNTEVIKQCFSVMRFQTVDNLEPEKDCDFNALPPSKKE